jgi:hypothetical protein
MQEHSNIVLVELLLNKEHRIHGKASDIYRKYDDFGEYYKNNPNQYRFEWTSKQTTFMFASSDNINPVSKIDIKTVWCSSSRDSIHLISYPLDLYLFCYPDDLIMYDC